MKETKISDFYTILKEERNFFANKMSERKYLLYDKKQHKLLITAPFICPYIDNNFKPLEKYLKVGLLKSVQLRDSQKTILAKIIENFSINIFCGLIFLETGGGKTFIMMGIIDLLKVRTLIITKGKLVEQVAKSLKDFMGVDAGIFNSSKKNIQDITVTTHTSFCNQNGNLGNFDLILYDECHESLSDKMILALCNTSAKMLYGFSGTPYTARFTQMEMQKIFGLVLEDTSFQEYYIPEIVNLNYYSSNRYITESAEYAELRTVMSLDKKRKEKQAEYIIKILKKRTGDVIIMSDRLEEVNFYVETVTKLGENVVNTNTSEAIEVSMERAKKWKSRLVIIGQYRKIGTGFDHPPIDTAILFNSIKIKQTVLQGIGRALRQYPDKEKVMIYLWNDMNLKSQRLDKNEAIQYKFGEKIIIHDIDIRTEISSFSVMDSNFRFLIDKFNGELGELNTDGLQDHYTLEDKMTTAILGIYRKRGLQCYKIPDNSAGAKPYDAEVTTSDMNYPIEFKVVNGLTFNSKILRDVQYSNLKKKLESKVNFPLVGVYSSKVGKLKYIPFWMIYKKGEISIKLF